MRPRRRYERFVRRLETEFVGEGKNYRAISSDFSRYGLFIRTNHAFVPGTELDIVIHLPDGTHCRLKGLVRRAIKTPIVSLKNGMGIELTSRDTNYIKFLLNKLLVAASVSAVTLANAGLLQGKNATVDPDYNAAVILTEKGANHVYQSVVVDDNIITSNHPRKVKQLGDTIVAKLSGK